MGNKIRLGIIYGGKSSEHEVSLRTALSIMKAVDPNKYEVTPVYVGLDGEWIQGNPLAGQIAGVDQLRLSSGSAQNDPVAENGLQRTKQSAVLNMGDKVDVVFPVIHGPNGEDGTIQGLLELANLPYVGTGVMASAVGMDKWMMKNVFAQAGLNQCKYIGILRSRLVKEQDQVIDQIETELGYPCFVKPANMGSSVGISKAKDRKELMEALALAAKFDRRLVVEAFVKGREVEIGVLGNEELITSVVGEVIPQKEFYDYEAKYKGAGTELQIPAHIPDQVAERIAAMAKQAFQAIDGSGLSRVDFFWDEVNDQLYINEINTMPGFTPFSMYPMLFQAAGIEYSQLIDHLVRLALERHEEKAQNMVAAEELE
ncbi:MAG: D-alanine--D-alanine ligase [Clostridia bacterium]